MEEILLILSSWNYGYQMCFGPLDRGQRIDMQSNDFVC